MKKAISIHIGGLHASRGSAIIEISLGMLLYNIKDAYRFNTLDAEYPDKAVADGGRMVETWRTTSRISIFTAELIIILTEQDGKGWVFRPFLWP
jgi:hypothetical protein